jgi:hypothetical protein
MDNKLVRDVLLICTIAFLFIMECAAIAIYVWDSLHNIVVPSGVTALISAGLTYGVTALGFNHGQGATLQAIDATTTTTTDTKP